MEPLIAAKIQELRNCKSLDDETLQSVIIAIEVIGLELSDLADRVKALESKTKKPAKRKPTKRQ